jgi:hypothetical protein
LASDSDAITGTIRINKEGPITTPTELELLWHAYVQHSGISNNTPDVDR